MIVYGIAILFLNVINTNMFGTLTFRKETVCWVVEQDPMKDTRLQVAFYKRVGENIRKNRRKLNLSQDELARSIGLTRTSLTNIENGRQHPPLHTFYDIAQQLKIEPSALLPQAPRPAAAVDVKAIAERQVRGSNELEFIAAAIGIKDAHTNHDHTQEENRASGIRAPGRKPDQRRPRTSREDR
jgi:transcriptional regulator with XRE-family HTH domain